MKNFASILTFIAISASVVSARALPAAGSLEARFPYSGNDIVERSPKKNKAAANGTASAATAVTSGAGGKKAKAGAAAASGSAKPAKAQKAQKASGNSTVAGVAQASGASTGKKAKVIRFEDPEVEI